MMWPGSDSAAGAPEARPAAPPRAPILVVDRDGVDAASRFELGRKARARGWTPVELRPGDDYPQVDSAAVEHHADAVAFVGAETSQSKAAIVASGRELPYACVPTGHQNVFARDLGIDPDDDTGALAAFEDYCEYFVDLGEVNGVTFLNYVALGLDCTPVRPALAVEPRAWPFTSVAAYVVSCHEPPARLHWFPSWGRESCAALFVSNNCRRFESHAIGGRPRLDGGVLGIGVLGSDRDPHRGGGWRELHPRVFEVDAGVPLRADVDGRQVSLEPPVRFRILPRALRVRIPVAT
jgi:hypothetical protein